MTEPKWRRMQTPYIPGLPRFAYTAADCPDCNGTGADPLFAPCPRCDGGGLIYPPGEESPAEMVLRLAASRPAKGNA